MMEDHALDAPFSDVGIEDLRRPVLIGLCVGCLAIAWIWTTVTGILSTEMHLLRALTPPLVLMVTGILGLALRRLPLPMRSILLLIGLAACLYVGYRFAPSPVWLYYLSLIVIVTGLLAGPGKTFVVSLALTLIVLLTLWPVVDSAQDLSQSLPPLGLLWATAITTWLSSRNLYAALQWALFMTQQAQRNAEEARERRAEVRSILKSLEEAYLRLERTNQALLFAREAAERAYRFKAEFVANVSHELRTPLNLIVGFSEMMATAPESYKGKRLPSQYRGDVMAIYHSARHLSDLIDDVLDLAQMESGKLALTREPADLGEIVREAADLIRGLAQAKGLRVNIVLPPALPTLQLDRTRIRQVLLNLLSNATRFTDQGWVEVRVSTEGESVRVSVEDSGRGISRDKIQQAFQAFSQLDDDRARQGTGLGLAVSRRFVELHGGAMWIESVLGSGTTVCFTLPTATDYQATPGLVQTHMPGRERENRPYVLVLHDDRHVVTLLQRHVEGFRFVHTDTVESAVEFLQQMQPLAVVMESVWKERWEWIEAAAEVSAPLPILTCPLPSLRRTGLRLGAADYLAKPMRREDLVAALARLPVPPRTVLVVDDDPDFARLLVRMLKGHDETIEVLLASGGAEGLTMIRSRAPDLVLLDLLMPEVNGYDLLEKIRSDPSLKELVVILMSAHSFESEEKPLGGELKLHRRDGFVLTEVVQGIQALLGVISQPAAVAQASVAVPEGDPPA